MKKTISLSIAIIVLCVVALYAKKIERETVVFEKEIIVPEAIEPEHAARKAQVDFLETNADWEPVYLESVSLPGKKPPSFREGMNCLIQTHSNY